MPLSGYSGVKVFCATTSADRHHLGEAVTGWLAENPGREVVDTVVNQSSDQAFHCITIAVFHREKGAA